MELYRIEGRLTKNGLVLDTKIISDVKETPKTYIFGNSRLSKEKLNKADTIFRNTLPSSMIYFESYCLPEDEKKAREIIKNKIIERYDLLSDSLNELTVGLSK